MPRRVAAMPVTAVVLCLLAAGLTGLAHAQPNDTARGRVTITTGSAAERRAWTTRVDAMLRSGELRIRQTREDTLLPGRIHERADQYYRGVRVFDFWEWDRQLNSQCWHNVATVQPASSGAS